MSNVLEYLDPNTKLVIKQIVEKFEKDIELYSNNNHTQTNGIGITFIELINSITHCEILSDKDNSFGIKFKHKDNNFDSVREAVCYHGNNGFILQTKVLQILDFIIKLHNEGIILFTDVNTSKSKPKYKGAAHEDCGTMFFPIHNSRINEFISEIYYSHIVPTTSLIGFKKRGYKTAEQDRFEDAQCTSNIGIIVALVIAAVSPLLMTHCSISTINSEQFDSLIKEIQVSNSEHCCDTLSEFNSWKFNNNQWINYE